MSWRLRSPKTLAHRWPLNGHADDLIRGQHGTLVNTPTWAINQFGKQCIELDGNTQHINVGDVVALNSVSAFTLCWWMNQDVANADDTLFRKRLDGTNEIRIYTAGSARMYFVFGGNYGFIAAYSGVVPVSAWNHLAMIFDGTQTGDADRLRVLVNGEQQTLVFGGTIPATTPDTTGYDLTIGRPTTSFDGELSDFRLFYVALTRDEINRIIHSPQPTY